VVCTVEREGRTVISMADAGLFFLFSFFFFFGCGEGWVPAAPVSSFLSRTRIGRERAGEPAAAAPVPLPTPPQPHPMPPRRRDGGPPPSPSPHSDGGGGDDPGNKHGDNGSAGGRDGDDASAGPSSAGEKRSRVELNRAAQQRFRERRKVRAEAGVRKGPGGR
jgi:hypothetical protein